MYSVNIHEAKTRFSQLVDIVAGGKEIIIAKAGKPIAKLVPLVSNKKIRKFGVLKGKITISSDFDKPLPENIIQEFEEG